MTPSEISNNESIITDNSGWIYNDLINYNVSNQDYKSLGIESLTLNKNQSLNDCNFDGIKHIRVIESRMPLLPNYLAKDTLITHVIYDVSFDELFNFLTKIFNDHSTQNIGLKMGIEIDSISSLSNLKGIPKIAVQISTIIEVIDHYFQEQLDKKFNLDSIFIPCKMTGNFFYDISAIRATIKLWNMVSATYKSGTIPNIKIYSTSERNPSNKNDDYHILQHVTNIMAACIGGSDVISIIDTELSTKQKADISNIIKEETSINKVYDPYSGTYMVESLTDQLINEALDSINNIEQNGGILNFNN